MPSLSGSTQEARNTGTEEEGLVRGLGVLTGLVAQTASDSPQRVEQKRTDLTGAPDMEVIASIVEFKPGESGAPHFHHGVEVAYVLQGASLQAPGRDVTMLPMYDYAR